MIAIENQVFTQIANAFLAAYPSGYITPEYVGQPSKFPAVYISELDNRVMLGGRDSGAVENFAEVMYQVDVFSNRSDGKKEQCKAIAKLVDEQFALLGFTRTFLNPVPNADDATIYRMTGRYRAVVSKDELIFRS